MSETITVQTESVQTLARRNLNSMQFIDVRTPGEYRTVHAQFAQLVPLDELDPETLHQKTGFTRDQPLYILCQAGGRAKTAAEKLCSAGITNCVVVEGGTNAWVQAGLPVVRGQGTISIERQVRIAAGAIVVTGILLGWFVNPWFFLLSGFVGAGLVFAGVTDWCGMALLLAKMPWNK